MKEFQQDLDEARQGRDDLAISAREAERKLKTMEQEHMQSQEVLTKSSIWTSKYTTYIELYLSTRGLTGDAACTNTTGP